MKTMQIKFISERLLFNLKEEHLRGVFMESIVSTLKFKDYNRLGICFRCFKEFKQTHSLMYSIKYFSLGRS